MSMQHPRTTAATLALLGALLPLGAAAGQLCEITYQYKYAAEGENPDTVLSSSTTTACVESLTDCEYRAGDLAREDARAIETMPDGQINLSTIQVTDFSIEGDCEDPGGPPSSS